MTDMRGDFDALAETIKSQAVGKRVVFIPAPGNYGDALIRHGAKKFLKDHGIRHFELNPSNGKNRLTMMLPFLLRPSKHLFLYNGGGAFSPDFSFSHDMCRMISRFTKNLIVLPSTFAFAPTGVKGTLFRRDNFESRDNCPEALFCHDMAFYLYASGENYAFEGVERKPVGHFFRTDEESAGRHQLPDDNFDLSATGDQMTPTHDFFRHLAAYDTINTDRLHVGIAGLILKRRVNLYASNYFKIAAICKSSLEGDPNLTFMGETPFVPDGASRGAQARS